MYAQDHADTRGTGRFRWLVSTCLAAAVGTLAIVVVIYGSADPMENQGGLLPTLKRMSQTTDGDDFAAAMRRDDGLRWAIPKSDRLQITTGAMSTRFIIHETLKQRRNGREYIYAKPYVRLVARLAPVPPSYADVIPPFNPFKLYGNSNPVGSGDGDNEVARDRSDVSVRVVELLGGILPGEDGQELDTAEVTEIVQKSDAVSETGELNPLTHSFSAEATVGELANQGTEFWPGSGASGRTDRNDRSSQKRR